MHTNGHGCHFFLIEMIFEFMGKLVNHHRSDGQFAMLPGREVSGGINPFPFSGFQVLYLVIDLPAFGAKFHVPRKSMSYFIPVGII